MAKHFKTDTVESTSQRTARKEPLEVLHGDTAEQVGMPYGQAAQYHYSYPTAVPSDDYYFNEADVPARGGIRMVGRALLLIIAWAVRLCALAMFALLMLNVLSISPLRSYVTWATDLVTSYFPWRYYGLLTIDTPFGGVFRGDMAIITLLLFIVDWLICRLRANLR